ncbi:MAG: hypothetical protein JO197_13355 [Acidobacteria bacterium]|nr:hypothetical protein [Acidobacteriota bacterium]MBV9477682.1 hypothetical protein [Acidobacteriota bacterium]
MATDSKRPGAAGSPDPIAGASVGGASVGGTHAPEAQTTTYGAQLTTTHASTHNPTPPPPPRPRPDGGGNGGNRDDGPEPIITAPVYFKRRSRNKRRRNKKKYTKGTKPFQRVSRGAVWSGYRVGNGFARGLRTFARRSDRSANRRKDGFVRYALRDASAGFNSAARQWGRAPGEIANRIGTRLVRNTAFAVNNFVPFNPFNFGRR